MKILLLSLLLSSAACSLFAQAAPTAEAQIQKLQADANVLWIGEIYRDYVDLDGTREGRPQDRIDPVELQNGEMIYNHKQNTSIVKLQRPQGNATYGGWDFWFFEQISAPEVPVFADAELKKPLNKKEKSDCLSSQDSIFTFDPVKQTEVLQVVTNTLNPKDIVSYRTREILYFDKKAGIYQAQVLAIAPLQLLKDDAGKSIRLQPLFWLPVNTTLTPHNSATATSTPYIKSVQMYMPFSDCKELKTTQTREKCTVDMLEKVRQEKEKAFVVGTMEQDSELNPPLSAKEIEEHLAKNEPKNIVAMRLNHVFAWDEKTRKLNLHIYSVAPIVQRSDSEGPMFYLLPHKRQRSTGK